MNKNKFKQIAKQLYFKANEKVLFELEKDYDKLLQEINIIKKIDTTNVKPMFRIDEKRITFMREDVIGNVLNKKIIINNAPKSYQDFIIIEKVINSD